MTKRVVSVYTFKSVETILSTQGSQSWKLDPDRAAACDYCVVCRNANSPYVEGPEGHGQAFMIGKVRDVVPSTETPGRWLIRFSEYALGDWGPQWEGRNPVAYLNTNDFKGGAGWAPINFDSLVFIPMPEDEDLVGEDEALSTRGLTIAEAKAGLSIHYGVNPVSVEICIRG